MTGRAPCDNGNVIRIGICRRIVRNGVFFFFRTPFETEFRNGRNARSDKIRFVPAVHKRRVATARCGDRCWRRAVTGRSFCVCLQTTVPPPTPSTAAVAAASLNNGEAAQPAAVMYSRTPQGASDASAEEKITLLGSSAAPAATAKSSSDAVGPPPPSS